MGHFPRMEEELDLTEAERELLEQGHARQAETVHQARVLSQVYMARHLHKTTAALAGSAESLQEVIKGSTEKVIESNEELAVESRRYARALSWLTGALVLVPLAQVVLPFVR